MSEEDNHLEITLLEDGQQVVEDANTEVCSADGKRYMVRGERKPNGEPKDTDISEQVAFQRAVSYFSLFYQRRGNGDKIPKRISIEFGDQDYP